MATAPRPTTKPNKLIIGARPQTESERLTMAPHGSVLQRGKGRIRRAGRVAGAANAANSCMRRGVEGEGRGGGGAGEAGRSNMFITRNEYVWLESCTSAGGL